MSSSNTLFRLKLLSTEVALLTIKICSIANIALIITQSARKYPLVGILAHANLYVSFRTISPNCIFTYKFSLLTLKEPFGPYKANSAHSFDRPKLDFTLYTITALKIRLGLLAILENTLQLIPYRLLPYFTNYFSPSIEKTVIEQKFYAKGYLIVKSKFTH